MKRRELLAGLCGAVAGRGAPAGFAFHENAGGALELSENGRPVFAYNFGMQLRNGAPERYRRSTYVHPLWAPNGVVLSDDFPRDHFHHRGLAWMWPVVRVDGEEHDLWVGRGIRQKFLRWTARQAGPATARLGAENGWFTARRQVLKESVEIIAHPDREGRRRLDFGFALEALGDTVEIAGTSDQKKGYGGFCLRFAPREGTVITTERGREPGDSDMVPHPWAELDGTFGGRRASARIEDDQDNPGFPNGWCLRHYGFLGVNFPGLKPYRLEPGRPLVLTYRVTLSG